MTSSLLAPDPRASDWSVNRPVLNASGWKLQLRWSGETGQSGWWLSQPVRHDPYHRVDSAVRDAHWILRLPADWDEAGSPQFNGATFERARELLEDIAFQTWTQSGRQLHRPRISPADAGSIDLFWKGSGRSLLINIPGESDAPVTFFGKSAAGDTLGGEIRSPDMRAAIATWLQNTR